MELLKISFKLAAVAALITVAGITGSVIGQSRAPEQAAAVSSGGSGTTKGAPIAQSSRAPYPTRTAAEVLAGLAKDPFWTNMQTEAAVRGPEYDPRVATGTLGQPLLVHALRSTDEDAWIVPVLGADGKPVALIGVSQRRTGVGVATSMRGWPYTTVPAVSEADARAKGSLPNEAVTSALLVYSDALGRPADLLSPFWRVVNSSGNSVFVFADGTTRPGKDFGVK